MNYIGVKSHPSSLLNTALARLPQVGVQFSSQCIFEYAHTLRATGADGLTLNRLYTLNGLGSGNNTTTNTGIMEYCGILEIQVTWLLLNNPIYIE